MFSLCSYTQFHLPSVLPWLPGCLSQDTYPSSLFKMEPRVFSKPDVFQFTLGKQHHLPSYASQNLAGNLHFTPHLWLQQLMSKYTFPPFWDFPDGPVAKTLCSQCFLVRELDPTCRNCIHMLQLNIPHPTRRMEDSRCHN